MCKQHRYFFLSVCFEFYIYLQWWRYPFIFLFALAYILLVSGMSPKLQTFLMNLFFRKGTVTKIEEKKFEWF